MPTHLFQERLERELGPIDQALKAAQAELPESCYPVAAHILNAGGKRLRPLLTILCARALGYSHDDIYRLAITLEMLHAATLLHDDVLDNALSRRGQPTAHGIFGVVETILAGDALLATGNAIVASFDKPQLVACYSSATSQTAAGEILEMSSLRKPQLSFEQYLEIARGKTACLIAQSCVMGAKVAGATSLQVSAFSKYGENLGLAFQLIDDALDFAPESQTGKPSAGDLREGKMTPPINLYRASLSEEERGAFDANFIKGAFNDEQMRELAQKIASFIPQARALANDCLNNALTALDAVPAGVEREILSQMAHFVANRVK